LNLFRSLATVSSFTLLSRILGFVRDFVIARTFGAGPATDAFIVAFRLPNLLRRLFAEGAFSQAFVPILSEYRSTMGSAQTQQLINRVATLLSLVVAAVAALGALLAPLIITISAPGFTRDPDTFALTVELTRITFPYIFFMALVALAGGILNTWSRFAIPAFTPVLLNLSFIGMALWAAPYFDPPILVLGWAVFLGGLLQVLLQIRPLWALGLLPKPTFGFQDPGVRRVLRLMAPALLGVSVSQISLLINTIFASFLQAGSVSWLYYADRLMEFPAGLLGATLGTILLPSLSKMHATQNVHAFSALLDWGLRMTLLLTLPASLGLALLAVPLLATLFQHGAFRFEDVLQTRQALVAYSVGLTGLILVKVLAPGFYARQNIRAPVRFAILSLVATQIMNLIFIGPLAHAGLALSIALASLLNAGLLYRGLRKDGTYTPQAGWGDFLLRLFFSLGLMTLFLGLGTPPDEQWALLEPLRRLFETSVLILGAMAVYFGTLFLLGVRLPRPRLHQKSSDITK
jgi:putative peptidoglycan lipid II flippase